MKDAIEYYENIHLAFWKTSQSVEYEWIGHYRTHGQKVRVEIKRDAYDHQSYYRCSVWDDHHNEWHVAVTLPANKDRSAFDCNPYTSDPLNDDEVMAMHADRDELLDIVTELF